MPASASAMAVSAAVTTTAGTEFFFAAAAVSVVVCGTILRQKRSGDGGHADDKLKLDRSSIIGRCFPPRPVPFPPLLIVGTRIPKDKKEEMEGVGIILYIFLSSFCRCLKNQFALSVVVLHSTWKFFAT